MTSTPARSKAAPTPRALNLERRAEIGAERRARSRNAILVAACRQLGTEAGQAARIEDICAEAGIARGTFYNHFTDLDQLKHELLDELTREFDHAVHMVFNKLEGPVEQTAVAVRYYLHAAAKNPEWGWAMVNSGTARHIFGKTVWHNSLETIREGMAAGAFDLPSAEIGRDILMGTTNAATGSIVRAGTTGDYPEMITQHILMSFGLTAELARDYAFRALPPLPATAHESIVIANMPALGEIGS